jgi:hypothetical protein
MVQSLVVFMEGIRNFVSLSLARVEIDGGLEAVLWAEVLPSIKTDFDNSVKFCNKIAR